MCAYISIFLYVSQRENLSTHENISLQLCCKNFCLRYNEWAKDNQMSQLHLRECLLWIAQFSVRFIKGKFAYSEFGMYTIIKKKLIIFEIEWALGVLPLNINAC